MEIQCQEKNEDCYSAKLEDECNGDEACIATGRLLSPFVDLTSSSAGEEALQANLQKTEEIYLNSTRNERAEAATNSQLQEIVIPIRNVWVIAAPELSEKFNSGNLPDPGSNAPPQSYLNLISGSTNDFTSIVSPLKNYFATFDVYGNAYGHLPNVTNRDPRPFQVSQSIYSNAWTPANTDLFAVEIQQCTVPPPPYADESWEDLSESPAFPSGHSTIGNTIGIISAMTAPQYFKELVYAGTQFSYSRVIFGAHYSLDVIGGRIVATYNIANALNGTYDYDNPITLAGLKAAGVDLQDYLGSGGESPYAAACAEDVGACIRAGVIPSAAAFEQEREAYRYLLTFGLPPVGATDLPSIVPEGAEILLATRFPYLSKEQRRSVLATTQIPSWSVLDDGSGWARLDLFSAADGFGSFDKDVSVSLDASQGGFNAFDIWANNITGTGGLIKNGSGTLVLAGDSSYSGGTNIQAGTLALSGSIKGGVTVADGAQFINGGSLTAIGSSKVVSAGNLINDGVIQSDVMNSGYLSGNGQIKGDLVTYGTVAPGNSIGRMDIDGTVTFKAGSVYEVDIAAAGRSDLLAVTGPVTLNDVNLSVSVSNPSTIGLQSYSILTSDTEIDGSVGSLTDPFASTYPFIDLTASVDSGVLTLATVRSDVSFTSAAQTPNQVNVAEALDSLAPEGGLMDALVSLDRPRAPAAFVALSGEIYASAQTVLQTQSIFLRDAIGGRQRQVGLPSTASGGLKSGPQTAPLSGMEATIWMQGYKAWGSTGSSSNTGRLSRSIGGGTIGFDVSPREDITLGLAGGYSRSSFDIDSRRSTGDSDNYDLAVYAVRKLRPVNLRGALTYTWSHVSIDRDVIVLSYSGSFENNYDVGTAQAFAEIGYDLELQNLFVEPFANIAYVNRRADGFTEYGGGAALRGIGYTQDNGFSTLGLRVASDLPIGDGRLSAEGRLGWLHTFGDLTPEAKLAFATGSSSFFVDGAPLARDSAVVNATLGYRPRDNVILGLSYFGLLADSARDNAITAQISVAF
ncbi:autotransporter domain-containing protein [Microbulbifer sp. SSSA002]|uniref:autotransporter domain-containing protein n=1 Tax=Microbulbifer sp. SSSA002 TaxID=3243376 RepID=UPI0040392C9F